MCLERLTFHISLTFSSLRYVDVEDIDDLLDIVEDDLEVYGKSCEPWIWEMFSSVCTGIDDLRFEISTLRLGNKRWWLGIDSELINIALDEDESVLSR